MTNFNRGGEGMSCGQSDHANELSRSKFPIFGTGGTQASYQDLSSCPISINHRLLSRSKFPIFGTGGTSLPTFCSDEGGESRRTTFGLASPLLRPFITDSSRIHHRFNTSASGILDENVMKRCSEGGKTPKLVRSRYESDQEVVDLAPTVYQLSSAQDLPWFYFGSASLRSARDGAVTWSRLFIGAPSQPLHSVIGASSEKGRTWLGLGRYQVGSFSAYSLPIGCFSFGLQPRNNQRTTEEQTNNNQGKTKQSSKKEQRIRGDVEHTWVILRNASTIVAGSFGRASGWGRTCMQSCSTAVRQLFGSCSAVRRRTVEALSKTTRRSLEAVPNQSRSGLEGESKNSRRQVEAKGAQTKVKLALTQPITRVELGMNYQITKDELTTSLERTNDELAKEVPERYCKGTGKVLNSGGKGTGEVLESYQRGTKEVLTGSRSVVALERDGGESQVACSTDDTSITVDDLRMNRLILKHFRALCEEFRGKVESMVVGDKIKQQKGLKCVHRFKPAKTKVEPVGEGPSEDSEQVLHYGPRKIGTQRGDVLGGLKLSACLMIFCVLFSFPDLLGARAIAQIPQQRDNQQVRPLLVGQRVPDEFWTKEHLFYNAGDTVRSTLEAYKGKMLILGFWATWCSSCLLHEPIIQKYMDSYPQDLAFIKVNPVASKDDLTKIDKTMRLNPSSGTGPGSVIYDSYLDTLFPHHGYPSYVWINKLGIVQMVTFRNLLDQNFVAPFITYKR